MIPAMKIDRLQYKNVKIKRRLALNLLKRIAAFSSRNKLKTLNL